MDSIFGPKGDYNYAALCMPSYPCQKSKPKTRFYSKDEPMPLLLALLMGLQHAFAMVGGLITPPFVVFKFTIAFMNVELQQAAISTALITSGICTLINIMQVPIPLSEKIFGRKMYIGSGVLSVMGTSFTFLPIFELAIGQMKADGIDPEVAYGKMLGTVMVCCFLEFFVSFLPPKTIKRMFPPMISSITIMLIGVALTGTGMKYWGGGAVCAEMGWKTHSQVAGLDAIQGPPGPLCFNGDVALGYGSPQFIGLGFSVMVFLIFIELFGSTVMKNCNVVLALLFGYIIAGVSEYEGNSFVSSQKIEDAKAFTFLWAETFPIGFYGPAVIPCLVAFIVTTVETVGDIGATYEASELDITSKEHESSVQGGLLADAFNTFLSALFMSMPNTTFSQNNGVIALTRCASKRAGYACACWLILMGIFGKVSGLITSIPDCVLGGMTIFLFCNVFVSGVYVASKVDLSSRRVRFIMSLSLCLGIGVTVWPYAFLDRRASPYTANFWPCADCTPARKGLRNGVAIFLSTGYCIGTVTAMFLNLILPEDTKEEAEEEEKIADEPVVAVEVTKEEC